MSDRIRIFIATVFLFAASRVMPCGCYIRIEPKESATGEEVYDVMSETDIRRIQNAVEAGIDAASLAVSALPSSQKAWGLKEYQIAEIAARVAIAALRQTEATP